MTTPPTTPPTTLHERCHCCASKDQPHPSRDGGPTCTWCERLAMDAIHDPRLGSVVGAQIKAQR